MPLFGLVNGEYRKELLVSRLFTVHLNYHIQLLTVFLLKHPTVPKLLTSASVVFESLERITERNQQERSSNLHVATTHQPFELSFAFFEILSDPQFAYSAGRDLLDSGARTAVIDMFEIVEEYRESNGLDRSQLEQFDWYRFLCFVRNALTHRYRWLFLNRRMRRFLPVRWNGKEITENMEHSTLTTDTLDFASVFILLQDAKEWAASL